MFGFWLVVLAVALVYKSRNRPTVNLTYVGTARIVNNQAVFACGCRYSLGSQERHLCQSHEAIVAAAARS